MFLTPSVAISASPVSKVANFLILKPIEATPATATALKLFDIDISFDDKRFNRCSMPRMPLSNFFLSTPKTILPPSIFLGIFSLQFYCVGYWFKSHFDFLVV